MSDFCLKVRLSGGTGVGEGVGTGDGVGTGAELGITEGVAVVIGSGVLARIASFAGAQAARHAVHARMITRTRANT